jgi:hypothetical protein
LRRAEPTQPTAARGSLTLSTARRGAAGGHGGRVVLVAAHPRPVRGGLSTSTRRKCGANKRGVNVA